MNNQKLFFKAGKTRFVICTAFLGMLTGVAGYADGPPLIAVSVQVPVAPVIVVGQDDYVYYPGYEVYYSRTRHQYVYPEGGVWVSRPAPRGVSVDVLMASPSVAVDFHDSPASHHAAMMQRYPRNWKQSDSDRGQTDDRKDDDHRHQ
jgi:uncharacterized protein YijF (DUF1287 family)